MSTYFNRITEQNKLTLNKGGGCDAVYYSELNEWYTGNAFRSFSLKYVVDRCIYYKVEGKEHEVRGGNFLLACQQPHVQAYFKSKEAVKSICIDISPSTVAEAFTIMSASQDYEFDNYLDKYFRYPDFFEAVCPVGATVLNNKLKALVTAIHDGDTDVINREWFLDLTEKVIQHSFGNFIALNGIHSVKLETRKELLSRLHTARQFIDDNLLTIDEVEKVASAANLSEFHFFRSFRQAFGITPYQYILEKKLGLARKMINERCLSMTDIAIECGFSDLFTFSRAFKRRFGISPSQFVAVGH